MRTLKSATLVGFLLFAAGSVFANAPRNQADDNKPASSVALAANDSDSAATAAPDAEAPAPDPAAQKKSGGSAADPGGSAVNPMAATTGTLGLFTLETGQTLPKGGWSSSAFLNKVTRMPGSVTVLNLGVNFGYGLTNRLTAYIEFDPYAHTHVSLPGQLSLRTPSTSGALFPQFDSTIYRRLHPGFRPTYVEDYPFAANNDGGVGGITVGLKFGVLSEDRGSKVSLSLRNDFLIPTRTALGDLLDNGTQAGAFADQVTMALSKNWGNALTLTLNAGYRFTMDPKTGSLADFHSADQLKGGAGFILFPQSRVQVMSEYTTTVFTGRHTPVMTFGARDPVDGVWGVRLYLNKAIAVDAGYRYMLNLSGAQDRSGFIVKIGTAHLPEVAPPVKVNQSPVVACSADKASVFAGSNDVVNITATASDPDGDPITYNWTATGGAVDGTGPQVRWAVANLMPGNYTATVRVDDGRGGNAMCSVSAAVAPRPNRPPTVSLSPARPQVLVGETDHFTATASDPDGDPLTYTWRTNGGRLSGTGAGNDLDTTGVTPGPYTVTVRVEDGRGGAADASATIQVNAPPPPPVASQIIPGCNFKAVNSARVDNICKRVLDDVALRMQNDPRAKVVLIGFADPKERKPDTMAGTRGTNAADYLASKGVDRSRITTRTGAGQTGAGQTNRRLDIFWVPEGATY